MVFFGTTGTVGTSWGEGQSYKPKKGGTRVLMALVSCHLKLTFQGPGNVLQQRMNMVVSQLCVCAKLLSVYHTREVRSKSVSWPIKSFSRFQHRANASNRAPFPILQS